MSTNDSLGDRIKRYEAVYDHHLTPRSCVVVRIDGRAFHTLTRKHCSKPFDDRLIQAMTLAARYTSQEIQGFRGAYLQSDEVTFLLSDLRRLESQGWFDYSLNKIVSISASLFTAYFNMDEVSPFGSIATFDSRAFVVPQDDVANVFVWRQKDWERNSLQMFARSFFSHKQLHGKGHSEIHEMLHEIGQNWTDLAPVYKNGTFITEDGQLLHMKMDYEDYHRLLFGRRVGQTLAVS